MKKLLVDTNILIDFLRGIVSAKEFLLSAFEDHDIYCSVVSVAELHAGMRESERERTKEFLDGLNIADVTRRIAEKAGEFKRTEKRQSPELDDCLIGATAFVIGAVLATENEKQYPMKDVKKIAVKRQQAG